MKRYKNGEVIEEQKQGPQFNLPFLGSFAPQVNKPLLQPNTPIQNQIASARVKPKKSAKKPTWNINNPLSTPGRILKNTGMFTGAIGIALINSLINDVIKLGQPNTITGKYTRHIDPAANKAKKEKFDIRNILFPNKYPKK